MHIKRCLPSLRGLLIKTTEKNNFIPMRIGNTKRKRKKKGQGKEKTKYYQDMEKLRPSEWLVKI